MSPLIAVNRTFIFATQTERETIRGAEANSDRFSRILYLNMFPITSIPSLGPMKLLRICLFVTPVSLP